MSWTRSAAARAGLSGTLGAALLLASLSPTVSSATSQDVPVDVVEGAQPVAITAVALPVPDPVRPEDVAASESARDRQQASRSQQRADLMAAEQMAQQGPLRPVAQVDDASTPEPSPAAAPPPPPTVVGERYTTTRLNVRSAPAGAVVTVLDAGTSVSITDRTDGAWQQIRYDGQDLWVSGDYLSTQKPAPPPEPAASAPSAPGAPSTASCSQGSGIESGLSANARAVYRAVCGRWPQISGYGGYRPDGGSHGSGRALDIMVSGALGWEVATWVRANAGALGVSEVIHSQQIWTVQRSGDGWRAMSDRGSATANHYDHVHVTVY